MWSVTQSLHLCSLKCFIFALILPLFCIYALNFTKDIDQRIMEISGEKSSTFYLMQVIGMAIQRGSSACILETVTDERIYNPIMAMGFSAMFTFQLDNTKR